MRLARLWLTDFRCYDGLDLELPAGCTVITGANGQGKTSLLEAVDWIATGRSFRGVPDAALTRAGTDTAIVRAEIRFGLDDAANQQVLVPLVHQEADQQLARHGAGVAVVERPRQGGQRVRDRRRGRCV
mgnify:CR=1 FL=1